MKKKTWNQFVLATGIALIAATPALAKVLPLSAAFGPQKTVKAAIRLDEVKTDGTVIVSAAAEDESELPKPQAFEIFCFTQAIEPLLKEKPLFELKSFLSEVGFSAPTLLQTPSYFSSAPSTDPVIEFKVIDLRTKEVLPATSRVSFEMKTVQHTVRDAIQDRARNIRQEPQYTTTASCKVNSLSVLPANQQPITVK